MPLSLTFGLILSAGCGLVVLALWLISDLGARHRRLTAIRRFSGEVRSGDPLLEEADAVALRRDALHRNWLTLFASPTGGRADIVPRHLALILILTVTTIMTLLAHVVLGLGLTIGIATGLILSLVIWVMQVRRLIRRRAFAIEEALPEAMDLIVRSLKVGLPVGSAVQTAGKELSGPLAEEFSETSARISYGQEPVGTLRDMANRTDSQGLRFFAAAVAIQSSTGGNLAEVLERLSSIARGRQQLRRKVRSITSEAKWSGRFLSFFPLGATVMLLVVNPDYFSEISDKPFFVPMLGLVATLLFLNILFMHWLVKVE
ncbi:type II secretion system F family protein [Pseudogemmobacter bohemicus]|uniref:type II secretion system F family protein n=1 Tax=Pseudogemmobacter bohemicus TaxID=2250708 RepID=UPI000DD4D87E|nr:type II secretion system F family protein [Pseudogemmobacter bohemicus]